MHSNLDHQDLLRKGSPWQPQARSQPLIHSTSDPIRPHSSMATSLPTAAFYSKLLHCTSPPPNKILPSRSSSSSSLHGFLGDDPVVSSVVPSVTVVLDGRSICQRINLHSHSSYASLARALRQMFGGADDVAVGPKDDVEAELELGNAIPGHLVAYEDFENDLLLAGDLSWNDFVRVAKRIRIVPVKQKSKRPKTDLKQSTST